MKTIELIMISNISLNSYLQADVIIMCMIRSHPSTHEAEASNEFASRFRVINKNVNLHIFHSKYFAKISRERKI